MKARAGRVTAVAVVSGMALLPGWATAQRIRFAGDGSVSHIDYRVDDGTGRERFSGFVGGAGATALIGPPVRVRVALSIGRLQARTPGALDRDFAQGMADVTVPMAAWLDVGAGLSARAYQTDAGRQRWALVRLGGEARWPFLDDRLRAVFRVAYLPVVSVAGLGAPRVAFAAATGMEWRAGPGTVRLLYTLERYDFSPGNAAPRPEQLMALTLAVGARFGR